MEQVRIIYSSATQEPFPEHDGEVFAIIGPFKGFQDKPALQEALESLLIGWNNAGDRDAIRAALGEK